MPVVFGINFKEKNKKTQKVLNKELVSYLENNQLSEAHHLWEFGARVSYFDINHIEDNEHKISEFYIHRMINVFKENALTQFISECEIMDGWARKYCIYELFKRDYLDQNDLNDLFIKMCRMGDILSMELMLDFDVDILADNYSALKISSESNNVDMIVFILIELIRRDNKEDIENLYSILQPQHLSFLDKALSVQRRIQGLAHKGEIITKK